MSRVYSNDFRERVVDAVELGAATILALIPPARTDDFERESARRDGV